MPARFALFCRHQDRVLLIRNFGSEEWEPIMGELSNYPSTPLVEGLAAEVQQYVKGATFPGTPMDFSATPSGLVGYQDGQVGPVFYVLCDVEKKADVLPLKRAYRCWLSPKEAGYFPIQENVKTALLRCLVSKSPFGERYVRAALLGRSFAHGGVQKEVFETAIELAFGEEATSKKR